MKRSHFVTLAFVSLSAAACGRLPDLEGTARQQNFLLDAPVADAYWQETQLTRDVIALEDAIRRMTIAARDKGEAPGCVGRDLSDPALVNCTEAQLKTGWMGGLANLGLGPAEVASDKLSPALADIFAQLDSVDDGIDQMLIAQRTETLRLHQELERGLVTRQIHDARLAEMRENRKVVAETLALSADRAAKARRMLERARSKGQDGLSWYVLSMERIEHQTLSGQQRLSVIAG